MNMAPLKMTNTVRCWVRKWRVNRQAKKLAKRDPVGMSWLFLQIVSKLDLDPGEFSTLSHRVQSLRTGGLPDKEVKAGIEATARAIAQWQYDSKKSRGTGCWEDDPIDILEIAESMKSKEGS